MPPIASTNNTVPLFVQTTCERSVSSTSMRWDGPCTTKNEHPVANTADRASERMALFCRVHGPITISFDHSASSICRRYCHRAGRATRRAPRLPAANRLPRTPALWLLEPRVVQSSCTSGSARCDLVRSGGRTAGPSRARRIAGTLGLDPSDRDVRRACPRAPVWHLIIEVKKRTVWPFIPVRSKPHAPQPLQYRDHRLPDVGPPRGCEVLE